LLALCFLVSPLKSGLVIKQNFQRYYFFLQIDNKKLNKNNLRKMVLICKNMQKGKTWSYRLIRLGLLHSQNDKTLAFLRELGVFLGNVSHKALAHTLKDRGTWKIGFSLKY
jgi:hypothetical protein